MLDSIPVSVICVKTMLARWYSAQTRTYIVGAAARMQSGAERDRAGEEEDGVQGIEHDHDDGADGPAKVD